jgi:hypothetical protein
MTTKTYPILKKENDRLRERLREAISAIDHGNIPAWVLVDYAEAATGLLGLVDVLIDVIEAVSSLSATQAIAIRNEFAVKLGVDKRGE